MVTLAETEAISDVITSVPDCQALIIKASSYIQRDALAANTHLGQVMKRLESAAVRQPVLDVVLEAVGETLEPEIHREGVSAVFQLIMDRLLDSYTPAVAPIKRLR